jgi:hypothetical protein
VRSLALALRFQRSSRAEFCKRERLNQSQQERRLRIISPPRHGFPCNTACKWGNMRQS